MAHVERLYLVHLCARGLRPNTIAQAERILRWFGDVTGCHPLDATTFDIERYLVHRAHLATRAVEWSYLSMFFKWAVRNDFLDRNPMERVDRPRVPKRRPRPMPVDDLAMILRTAPERLRPWFYLATYCGLRACDIAPLHADDLTAKDGWLRVSETKGGGERWVPIPPVAHAALDGLPREGYLFRPRRADATGHVTAHLISELANRHLRSIGARQTFHGLRHWYGTNTLRAAGGNLRIAQEMLGHARSASTEVYTEVGDAEMVATAARLPIVA